MKKRVTRTYRQTIEAAPAEVFPLLCPVREAEWLEGWDYNMVYSESGLAEYGAVFTTSAEGEADTVWVISHFDENVYRIGFTRFTPGSRTCLLDIQVSSGEAGQSYVDISYTYTSLSAAGNAFTGSFTEEVFLKAVKFWEKSMNHFIKSGTRLTRVL